MCSGTESPLLALHLISEALKQADQEPIQVEHQFSAEIDVIKQGFIERNFQPPILFRDIREFIPDEEATAGINSINITVATTAYGAEVTIPSNIDILIAGFVCKDFSSKNRHKKGLNDHGESGDTWKGLYEYVKKFRPRIVLVENVKATKLLWAEMLEDWNAINYAAQWSYFDTKDYYLPQTRQRMYMVAIDQNIFGENSSNIVSEWEVTMKKLQRPCSSPYEAFLEDLTQDLSHHNTLLSEHDWDLCKLRNDQIRSTKGLGILRPLTNWSESGTLLPPDFANRSWYHSQSSRVYDAIDVAHLQSATTGSDSLYKMTVWDVSQNADRFKPKLGIVPCITPTGSDFLTNHHQTLNGKQLLLLQSMPTDKLLFARETQKDCQDLAGNAMSTTVIGASLISAIIHGSKALKDHRSFIPSLFPTSKQEAEISQSLVISKSMEKVMPDLLDFENADLHNLRDSAVLSARLCTCEGDKKICNAEIYECSDCGYTACTNCKGNPKHVYQKMNLPGERMQPAQFIQTWKKQLPGRVRCTEFAAIAQQATGMEQEDKNDLYFCLSRMSRQDKSWKVKYDSGKAFLELNIGETIQWLLFIKCEKGLLGNDPLRKRLQYPVARATVTGFLLEAKWEVVTSPTTKHTLHMSGSSQRNKSWRSRLGLRKYETETIPTDIVIEDRSKKVTSVIGEYVYLPNCGTACSSLYKRKDSSGLYLFLDPDPIGETVNDSFVFSHDCSRKYFSDFRIALAHLDAAWRPWKMDRSVTVNTTISEPWIHCKAKLESAPLFMEIQVLPEAGSIETSRINCSQALTILNLQLTEESITIKNFSDYSWAMEQAWRLPSFQWQDLDSSSSEQCSCAPEYPSIAWVVENDDVGALEENRQEAAEFERAIKTRAQIFKIQHTNTRIQIGVNILALSHRARSRLSEGFVRTSWRLVTDHADIPPEPFPPLELKENKGGLVDYPKTIKYLHTTQPESLTWMIRQEKGIKISISEVEEEIHSGMGWRAEGRAEIDLTIRGGVLADLPSFGKTVTTIALIQSEFEPGNAKPDKADPHGPKPEDLKRWIISKAQEIVCHNKEFPGELPELYESAATLVVCPPHLAKQWQNEFEKFLGKLAFQTYEIHLISSFEELRRFTIDQLRDSQVLIVTWEAFAEAYTSKLAEFTALPSPTLTSRRAFNFWYDRVLSEIPGQLKVLKKHNLKDFWASTEQTRRDHLANAKFRATWPIKLKHGKGYVCWDKIRSEKEKPTKGDVVKPLEDSDLVPLLHLFRFNRVVVDEYHYLNDDKTDKKKGKMLASVSVQRIAAHKRWVLSGTPALENFSDVDQIASYLGFKLGRDFPGDGVVMTQLEKAREREQTSAEEFLTQTNIMSHQWHQARHERAQEFLDLFIRRNKPIFEEIKCFDQLVPVDLDTVHHAVYLDESQDLVSRRIQMKKPGKASRSKKNPETEEEVLLRSTLHIEKTSLHAMIEDRKEAHMETMEKLNGLVAGFEGKSMDEELTDLYSGIKKDIMESNWLGDNEATLAVRGVFVSAQKGKSRPKAAPKSKASPEVKKKQEAKKLLSQIRAEAQRVASTTRRKRFIENIQVFQKLQASNTTQIYLCDSPGCLGTDDSTKVLLSSPCGHMLCLECLKGPLGHETCVIAGCGVPAQSISLIKMSQLGSAAQTKGQRKFVRKLDRICEIIRDIPKADQGLVFAPNDEIIGILGKALDHYGITYLSTGSGTSQQIAGRIESFKNDQTPKRKKVLLLNLGSESAAGLNLTNANHIIFVSPLLAESQNDYDAAMTQAIARCRRYGQKKLVHIYHVLAQRTIDVDILEHRHKRADGIAAARSSFRFPARFNLPGPVDRKKERTRLVQNKKGDMAIVPVSWVEDESMREEMDVKEHPESFMSLIKYTGTFEQKDE